MGTTVMVRTLGHKKQISPVIRATLKDMCKKKGVTLISIRRKHVLIAGIDFTEFYAVEQLKLLDTV